jgi:uncharacterized protein
MKPEDFLAQKRIGVAKMSTFDSDSCYPSVGSIPDGIDGVVIVTRPETTEQIVRECHDAGIRTVWMHRSLGGDGSSVSPRAVAFCRQHGIDGIANGCPMMFGPRADLGHTAMRWILKWKEEI